jgi:hypothetical protein
MSLATITTWLASIPPVVIVILLGLAYCYLAAGRWSGPMLLDAGLAALYLWRPSLGMLAFVLLLLSVRHVPAFAREVVVMFKLDEFEGWTMRVLIFTLPALRTYATSHQDRPGAFGATLVPAVGPTVALPTPATSKAPLRPAEWLGAVNDDATAPHLGVVGPTRLGKTTFVLAALGRRAGRLVVTTPKGQDTDPWGGVAAHRLRADLEARSYDWQPIASAIDSVHYEMLKRNATAKAKDAEQITLVVDELSTTLANCDRKVKQQIMELWNMGAGAGIRLVVIDPEVNAAAWGVVGRRDILGNLVFARVEAPGRSWAIGRLDPNGRLLDPLSLDTAGLVLLAEQAQLAGREWIGVPPAEGLSVPPPAAPPPDSALQTDRQTQTDAQTEVEQRILKYVEWRKAGIKREQAALIRQGDGEGLNNNEWAEAGKRLGEKHEIR